MASGFSMLIITLPLLRFCHLLVSIVLSLLCGPLVPGRAGFLPGVPCCVTFSVIGQWATGSAGVGNA